MARNYRLKERGTGVTLYPETTTEQVYAPGGDSLKNLLPRMQEQINAKQPSVPGKGLSANDYSDDDKAAVGEWAEWKDSLFTIKGHTVDSRGIIVVQPQYDCTDFIPINRNVPLSVRATAGGGVPQVAFFDAGKKFISGVVAPGVLESEITDFPTGAVYFVISRFKGGVDAWYSHAPSLESIQGAAAQAIQMGKVALFDDMWKAAVGTLGKVDHLHVDEDGRPTPYYLNRLWLTYEEAVLTYQCRVTRLKGSDYMGEKIRTNIPFGRAWLRPPSLCVFYGCTELEVVDVSNSGLLAGVMTFWNARKLRTIIGVIETDGSNTSCFDLCLELMDVEIKLSHSVSFKDSPLLSLASLIYMVGNAVNTTSITITVHPDVYAKLTDETNAEWHKVLADALEKNISFATV